MKALSRSSADYPEGEIMSRIIVILTLISSLVSHAKSKRFPVIAYTTENHKMEVRYPLITDIIFCFLKPTEKGGLISKFDSKWLKSEVAKARKHKVRIFVAIGGWQNGDDSNFEKMAADEKARKQFVTNVIKFVRNYKLDGIDMDWEYPDPGKSADNFTLLMKALSKALKAQKKMLTMAVVAGGGQGSGVKREVFDYIDRLHIMTYDGPQHATMAEAEFGISYWTTRGISKDKLILGVPFYSRGSKVLGFKEIIKKSPEAYRLDNYDGMKYNGVDTMKKKVKLAYEKCSGIMFWQLSHDTNDSKKSLLQTINREIKSLNRSE